MKQLLKIRKLSVFAFCLLGLLNSKAQTCQNLALNFDGDNDYISLVTPPSVSGNANFTVEAWFTISSPTTTCGTSFRRLFSLSGQGSTRFEVGECNSQLKLFWLDASGGVSPSLGSPVTFTPTCHHIAVVRNGTQIIIYLDGALTPIYTGTLVGALNTNLFRVGHWGGGATSGSDWQGTIDDIRLWNVPRTATDIRDFKDCTLSGNWTSSGLIANWTLDQNPPIIPAGNNAGATVVDMSGNNNNGTFANVTGGFALNGLTSNFVCATCQTYYDLMLTNKPISTTPLTAICSGDPVHFCVSEGGNAITALPNATIMWQFADNGGIWNNVSNPLFGASNYCFYVPQGNITATCGATGNVNRKYRAKITKTTGTGTATQTCTYYTPERDLRIYCPITNANVVITPTGPFCVGDVVIPNISLTSTDPFVLSNLGTTVNVLWALNNVPLNYNNLSTFPYPLGTQRMCFKASVTNGNCPVFVKETCIDIDPKPACGLIDGMSTNLIPTGTPYSYLICPGNDAAIAMITPSAFANCNPTWQYHFDTDAPGVWRDLGTSNATQNTNVLPQTTPVLSPYLWPSAATCIFYRIQCRPLSTPSGCTPCISNEVKVCLQTPPANSVISGNQMFCKGGSTTLTIAPYGAYTYSWFWNGVPTNCTGQTCVANKAGCYVVQISNGCQTVKTAPYCIKQCEVVPIIKCPTDNPCACDGLPITLSGCNSYDTCGGTLTYTWTSTTGPGGTGCNFTSIPSPNGTTYTLTVTNAMGCSATSSVSIKPCQ